MVSKETFGTSAFAILVTPIAGSDQLSVERRGCLTAALYRLRQPPVLGYCFAEAPS